MRGVRFYLEYDSPKEKRAGNHNGTVIAVDITTGRVVMHDNQTGEYRYDAVGAVYYRPDSPVASTSVTQEYLAIYCKLISEVAAREIHPALFVYLDEAEKLAKEYANG